jgi:hypothetical protein
MKMRRDIFKDRLFSEQSGQALMLVLVFLLLGGLILVPLLDQINTALKTGVKYEDKSKELYAADAGIEDGIWRIKYEGLKALFGEDSYNYNFTDNATYEVEDQVNGLTTNVTINNIWIPYNETLANLGLSSAQAMAMMDSDKLTVLGTAGAVPHDPYQITIIFSPAAGDNLTIKSVGAWLPQGFEYAEGNCDLDDPVNSAQPYYRSSFDYADHCGGKALVWNYTSPYPLLTDFPNPVAESGNITSTINFDYIPPASSPDSLPSAIAWATTYMTDSLGAYKANDVPISWDTDTRIYKITSVAGGTKVEAYTSKLEFAGMDDASAGDYIATGNSLMGGNVERRSSLYGETSSNVTGIPSNAEVTNAYLYWSAYRDEASKVTVSTDTCSNFNNWDRSYDGTGQTRVPTADGIISGTWNYSASSCWEDVDETTPNDANYMTGTTNSGGYKLFTFSPFSISAGSPIANLTIYVRAKDDSSGTNNIRAAINVNGTTHNSTTSYDPGNSWVTYSYSFTVNPGTGSDWTVDDLNGTGANPLQQFGVYSTDLSPDIRVSIVYAEVLFSSWTLTDNEFQVTGTSSFTAAQRTLTMKNSIDLSSYLAGTTGVYWTKSKGGSLESDDIMYFAFSGDGGTTWSENIEAYNGDSTTTYFNYVIPAAYQTGTFKMRFCTDVSNYAEIFYVDNFKIYQLPPDTSITFKINGDQVYLDASGDPQMGAQPLVADITQVLFDDLSGSPTGYSYACKCDVTDLVLKYPVVPGEKHHTGNANYTVGAVDGSLNQYISYAGWSLILVYWSPDSAGHYFYLKDYFSYNPGTENLDFDRDGTPGGDVTGFVIPEPIRNRFGEIIETVAAKLTCFVGEGDAAYLGDSATMTGQNSNSLYLSNSVSSVNNVWNSDSPGLTCPGVDIDTFEVLWSDDILTPGDTWLHLDLWSGVGAGTDDAWNLIYIIVSVRSKTVIGATGHYIISTN